MATSPKKLICDTSVINALERDPEFESITRAIEMTYFGCITETVLAEVIANHDEAHRRRLLAVLDRLLHPGHCIMPFQWIVEQHAKAYQKHPQNYEWRNLNVRFFEGEQEIYRQEIIHVLSEEMRIKNRQWDKEFREIFTGARPAFQKLFEDPAEQRPSLKAVVEHLMNGGGAYLTIGADFMERATGELPSEDTVKDFISKCQPFKALLIAICFIQYDVCIRNPQMPSLGKAGRYDMYSAVYLAYCRVFVTNDEGQYKALNEVAELLGRDVAIVMYDEFRSGLLGLDDYCRNGVNLGSTSALM